MTMLSEAGLHMLPHFTALKELTYVDLKLTTITNA